MGNTLFAVLLAPCALLLGMDDTPQPLHDFCKSNVLVLNLHGKIFAPIIKLPTYKSTGWDSRGSQRLLAGVHKKRQSRN